MTVNLIKKLISCGPARKYIIYMQLREYQTITTIFNHPEYEQKY
jgi:hypothetical protein